MTFFEEHFRNLSRFSKICREIFKKIEPLYPLDICLMFGINLRPREHSKLLKMDPEYKSLATPHQAVFE
jgi:hypothetical protein